jgi:hypothetical protein
VGDSTITRAGLRPRPPDPAPFALGPPDLPLALFALRGVPTAFLGAFTVRLGRVAIVSV